MTLVYLLPLLIAATIGWLVVRARRDSRRERESRARLRRDPKPAKVKSREGSARSQMRAGDDPTTVASTLRTREPAAVDVARDSRAAKRGGAKL